MKLFTGKKVSEEDYMLLYTDQDQSIKMLPVKDLTLEEKHIIIVEVDLWRKIFSHLMFCVNTGAGPISDNADMILKLIVQGEKQS
jgi:hypothetical protein